MGKRADERFTRQLAAGKLDFSGTERAIAAHVLRRLTQTYSQQKSKGAGTTIRALALASMHNWFSNELTKKIDQEFFHAFLHPRARKILAFSRTSTSGVGTTFSGGRVTATPIPAFEINRTNESLDSGRFEILVEKGKAFKERTEGG